MSEREDSLENMRQMKMQEGNSDSPGVGVIQRAFALIRTLADGPPEGMRVTHMAKNVALTQPTVHRLLRALIDDGIVEQNTSTKLYRLSVGFFALAAQAGNPGRIREVCRPVLLRLCASLGETIFLFVRSNFDAVCVDMCDGPFPIRSFSGEVGGKVALGVGQGSLAILSFLAENEREEIVRINVPRLRQFGVLDEVYLRSEIERTRTLGYSARNTGVLEGMAGIAVPILDRSGQAIGALSVGTLSSRVTDERIPIIVELLTREAEKIGAQISALDIAARTSRKNSD